MSAPVPPPSRGLVTLDELRVTGHRIESRLARVEGLLEAVLALRPPAPPAAPPAPAFRPEPVGAAAELGPAAPPPAPPPAPAAPAIVVPPAPHDRRRSPEAVARKRATLARTYEEAELAGVRACEADVPLEACPHTKGGGIEKRRRACWVTGWQRAWAWKVAAPKAPLGVRAPG